MAEEIREVQSGVGATKRWNLYSIGFIIAVVLILVLTVYYRIFLLKYYGFYEPDGFYHYAVIRAAVSNNFVVPKYLSISGWPHSASVSEPVGLYWTTLVPYAILQFFGVSYMTVMQLIPVLFAIFDIVGAYYLVRYFNKDKLFGLLVMLLIALSMGDAARTSATVYRGDGFVTIYLIIALIFVLEFFKAKSGSKPVWAFLIGFTLSICNLVWNGAAFAIAIYILALVLIALHAFLKESSGLLKDLRYLFASLLIWFVFVNAYKALGLIGTQTEAFTGFYFILLFVFMLCGLELAQHLIRNRERYAAYVSTPTKRLVTFVVFSLIAVGMIYVFAPQIVDSIFTSSGFQTTTAFAASIEELQSPTPSFLFASFGPSLYTTPMSLAIYASSLFSNGVPFGTMIFWILMLIGFLPYLFIRVEGQDENRLLSGRAVWKFGIGEPFIVLVAFYAVTAYLQVHAVRFNSLLSIPLAIFTAYTLYWILLFLKNHHRYAMYAGLVLLSVFIVYGMVIDNTFTATTVPADNINPVFITALQWLKANSPSNSVVLTLWPDGSLVEAIANRTSVTDSVGSQNSTKARPFAVWLFNSSNDPQFLLSSINGRPDYLLVRYTWLMETSGVFTETELNVSPQLYAYNVFSGFQEQVNATSQLFTFTNPGTGVTAKLNINKQNSTQSISGYLVIGNEISPFRYIVFYNQQDGSYQVVQQTAYNATNNQTMLVEFSNVQRPGAYVNITGAYMLNTGIANSNMFKFIFNCGPASCAWNNSIAGLQLVYINSDTKIFRILYNSTATAG